jgi:TPR repeat protein
MMGVAGGADYDAKALAELYLYGRDGVSRDYTEAMRWLLRAGELGCTWSLGKVAEMYFLGLGVPKDMALGLRCLDRMYARVHHNGTGILDQELVFHWAMRSVIVGYLDDLGDDELFEWLQARTKAFSAECGALRSDYHREDGSVDEPAAIAMHVCKAFNSHARVKGELAEASRKIVDFRVGRIARLMERQKEKQEELAKSGDAPAQFYHSRTLPRYKGRAGHAQKWLIQSAEQGFSPAQYEAGKAFATGEGAPVSAAAVRRW